MVVLPKAASNSIQNNPGINKFSWRAMGGGGGGGIWIWTSDQHKNTFSEVATSEKDPPQLIGSISPVSIGREYMVTQLLLLHLYHFQIDSADENTAFKSLSIYNTFY
ncbi:hypothetical protein K501DRAFT_274985 [Backusella circina FSU 941]|nr:hypothetical protein K501DRAFT_274985 [Backusella circina FSU 941]